MTLLTIFDLAGVFVFAISGAIAGRRNDMDVFGMFMLALVTSSGGGILRSLLIGQIPPTVLVDPSYLIVVVAGTIAAFFAEPLWERWHRAVSFSDAIGLGVFVCIGVQVSLNYGLTWWAAIGMGMVTGTFGGILRDLLRAEIPLIFRKEIYATAALLGGTTYLICSTLGLPESLNIPLTTVLTATLRILAIRHDLHLPGSR